MVHGQIPPTSWEWKFSSKTVHPRTITVTGSLGWCLILSISIMATCALPQPFYKNSTSIAKIKVISIFVAKNMPYFSSFGTAFKKTRRKFSAETLSEALWLPFLLASSWHGYQAADWKSWKQDVNSTSRSQVITVDILLMEEIPSPTTWDVKNLTNNGINH